MGVCEKRRLGGDSWSEKEKGSRYILDWDIKTINR